MPKSFIPLPKNCTNFLGVFLVMNLQKVAAQPAIHPLDAMTQIEKVAFSIYFIVILFGLIAVIQSFNSKDSKARLHLSYLIGWAFLGYLILFGSIILSGFSFTKILFALLRIGMVFNLIVVWGIWLILLMNEELYVANWILIFLILSVGLLIGAQFFIPNIY